MVPATIVENCDFRPYGFCHEYPYGLFHAMSFPIGVRQAGYHGFCHVILSNELGSWWEFQEIINVHNPLVKVGWLSNTTKSGKLWNNM